MVSIRGRLALAGIAVAAAALVVASCAPAPGGGGTTTSTTIADPTAPAVTFVIKGGVGPAPAVVALAWTVSDVNGDPLTCSLDADGDGEAETQLSPCSSGSRNVSVESASSFTSTLVVSDGDFDVVRAVPVNVAAGTDETFDIVLRGVDELEPAQAAAFLEAEARWESVIVRGISDLAISSRPLCLPAGAADLPAVVDDVVIDVAVTPIDGPGSVLGQAGPNCYNTANELPIHGDMEFDSADVANLIAEGAFDEVIVHEMGHVLGFGTLWDLTAGSGGARKVIIGAGTSNPEFIGPRAVAEYSTLGAANNVPVEAGGGPGTRDAHWRESTFNNELMTGYINTGSNPLSRLTFASLADMGYQVDMAAADAYSLPGGAGALRNAPAHIATDGQVLRPTPGPV